MKKLLTIFGLCLSLSAQAVTPAEKEPVTITFPDGSHVTSYVVECELQPQECTIALTNGNVYTVLYTQVDDASKLSDDSFAGHYTNV